MTPDDVAFARRTRTELARLAGEALVVLPVGATEQHGPHLPVSTDALIVEHVARAAATAVADRIPILVAPALPFGSSLHHLPFGGTLSLGTETYYRVLTDLLDSLIGSGFRRVFVLNGHGGNQELVALAVRDLARQRPAALAAAAYWEIARPALAGLLPPETRLPGHAGVFETALVTTLDPAAVRPTQPRRPPVIPDGGNALAGVRREYHGFWAGIDGYTDDPAAAPAGAPLLAAVVAAVADAFVAFYDEATPRLANIPGTPPESSLH